MPFADRRDSPLNASGGPRAALLSMKKTLMGAIACFLLSTGAVSYAQQPPKSEQSQEEGTPAKLKGCLTKGSQPQQYVVADEGTGRKVAFLASAKVESYLNQTVEVSGRMVDRAGEKTFEPDGIKTVAASCKEAKE